MDDINRLWEEVRTMETRLAARLDRLAADQAIQHADNVVRLAKLEQFYWQSVGAGRVAKALWAMVAAILTSLVWWFKGYFK